MAKKLTRMIASLEKFSFAQMTSNVNGKTSSSGTMGVLICTVGTLCFFMGCIDKMFIGKDIDIVTQSIVFVGIGAALLGYRKSKDATGDIEIAKIENGAHENQVCDCAPDCKCGNCDRCQ